MGCHTWFWRPLTDQEFIWMKEYAVTSAEGCFRDETDRYLIDSIRKSVETGEACFYGMTWYEAGYGAYNPKFIEDFGSEPYVRYIKNRDKTGRDALYVNVAFYHEFINTKFHMTSEEFYEAKPWEDENYPWFHDCFRVHNYPSKVIHNKKELRRFLRKDYFKLTEEQRRRVSKFFELYPGGIITFG